MRIDLLTARKAGAAGWIDLGKTGSYKRLTSDQLGAGSGAGAVAVGDFVSLGKNAMPAGA